MTEKGPSSSVQVTLTMTPDDAHRFIEDWQRDGGAPVLTGGWQEAPVTVLSVVSSAPSDSGAVQAIVDAFVDEGYDPDGADYGGIAAFCVESLRLAGYTVEKGSCLCGCHSGAQMVCLCRAEDGEVCAADKGS